MATRTWVLTSDVHLIGPVVDVIVSMCRDAGFSGRHCRLNVPVAVTEAVTNAMLRGNSHLDGGQVTVSVVVDAERLLVDVTDEGQGLILIAPSVHRTTPIGWSVKMGAGCFSCAN